MTDDVVTATMQSLGVIMNTKFCTKCEELLPVENFSKDKYTPSGLRSACKSCSSKEFAKFKSGDGYLKRLRTSKETKLAKKQSDPKSVWAHHIFHNAKKRAKEGGLQFNITKEWVVSSATDVCPLLGITLSYGNSASHFDSASIDRLVPENGYTMDNCRIISMKANRIKTDATVEELRLFMVNIEKYYGHTS